MAVSMIKKWIRCEPAPWDMGVAVPVELRPSHTCVTCPNWSF